MYSNPKVDKKCYWAPEMFNDVSNEGASSLTNYKVDLWSLGVLIWYIFTFELPSGSNYHELEKEVYALINKEINAPDEFKELIQELLKRDPDERIECSQIKNMEFFKKHFDDYENKKVRFLKN
jgi:serine/threonine protein kinase